jgi:hypothetical protein
VRREFEVALELAREHGIRCEQPLVLSEGFNLLVELSPHPVVARIPLAIAELRDPLENARNEVAFAGELARADIAATRSSELIPAGPHERRGVIVSFWQLEQAVSRPLDARAAGRSLRRIHELEPDSMSFLPPFRPFGELESLIEQIAARRLLSASDLALLEEERSRLVALVPAGFDERPLHGDAHLGNVMESARGTLWIDLEDACRGPIEWDLATLQTAARRLGLDVPWREALAGYGLKPDAELLELMVELRGVYVAAAHAVGAVTIDECRYWRDRWLELLREDRAVRARS